MAFERGIRGKKYGAVIRRSQALIEKRTMIRTHMHKEPAGFVNRFTGYAETAGKVYGAAQTLYHVGRAVGTAARYAAPLLGLL